jgi:RHS repeat-associated protein
MENVPSVPGFSPGFSKLSSINQSGTNCATSGVCLTYDALGRVAEKKTGSAYNQVLYSPLGKTAVMNGQTLSYAYIPLPGGMTEYKPNNTTYRLWHKDWIGNARVVADLNGTIQEGSAISPYGEIESQNSYGTVTNEFSFTGDTQDLTAGLFDTLARELNQSEGRWISPDPAGASWNAYAYPTNPHIATDPSGAMQFYHTDCLCSGNGSGFEPDDFSGDSTTTYTLEHGAGATNPSSNNHMASPSAASDNATANGQSPGGTAQNTEVAQNQQPQQNPQQSNSQNSSDGINYKPGIPPAKGELEKVLVCTQNCTGKEFTVTSTNEAVKGHSDIHQPDTPHGRGEAADIRLPGGKADVGKALQCAANCGAKAAFDEYNHPSPHATGPHLHIQTVPTKSGGKGNLPEPED